MAKNDVKMYTVSQNADRMDILNWRINKFSYKYLIILANIKIWSQFTRFQLLIIFISLKLKQIVIITVTANRNSKLITSKWFYKQSLYFEKKYLCFVFQTNMFRMVSWKQDSSFEYSTQINCKVIRNNRVYCTTQICHTWIIFLSNYKISFY